MSVVARWWESEVVGPTAKVMSDDAVRLASEFFDLALSESDVYVTDVRPYRKVEVSGPGQTSRVLVDGYSGTVKLTKAGREKAYR